MTNDRSDLLKLAAKLADGIEVSDDAPEAEKIGIIAAISASFQTARGTTEPELLPTREPLFSWGHLQVLEKLGEGGFGEVYRAYDGVLDREVALKLRKGNRNSPVESRAFINEARRLARVRHPNVLAIHGADIHDGRVGLWMDLLQGQDLKQRYNDHGCIDTGTAYALALNMGAALTEVHAAGLVHGDIKASNVMLNTNDQYVLMDFGAGSEIHDADASPSAGTPLVMAPELFAGNFPSAATDQYSLGVLLFRQLSGEYPVTANSSAELAFAHDQRESLSLGDVCPSLPRGLISLVDSLLSNEPTQRPDAVALVTRIKWLLAAPQRRKRVAVVATIIASLSIGIVLATWGYVDARRAQQRAVLANQESTALNGFLAEILRSPRPSSNGKNTPVIEVVAAAAKRLEHALIEQPMARARARYLIGKSYREMGVPEKAIELLEPAFRVQVETLGIQHPDSLQTRAVLATALARLNRTDEARELLVAGLVHINQLPSDQALIKSDYFSTLTDFYARIDNEKQAEHYSRAALALVERRIYPRRYHELRQGLVTILVNQRRFEEAEPLARESLDWAAQNVPESGLTLVHRALLSLLLSQTGRPAEAETLIRRNIETTAAWLGPEDPYMPRFLYVLGHVLAAQGQLEDALAANTKALALSAKVQGENSWMTLEIMRTQAKLLTDTHQFETSEKTYVDLIDRVTTHFEPGHSLALSPRVSLVKLYISGDNYRAGLALARESLPLLQATLGEADQLTLQLQSLYGETLMLSGDFENAEKLLLSLTVLARENLGAEHELTVHAGELLAELRDRSED